MFVGKRMSKIVVAANPGMTLKKASHLLMEHSIHHLPVVEGDELVGIISDTDIRNSTFSETVVNGKGEFIVKNKIVEQIMVRDPETATPQDTVEDALIILHRRKFGALPVVEGKRLVGIITMPDILEAFIETLNIEGIGVRIEIIIPRDVKSLLALTKELSEMEVEVKSLILSPADEHYYVFIRISTINVVSVKERLTSAGFIIPELSDFLD